MAASGVWNASADLLHKDAESCQQAAYEARRQQVLRVAMRTWTVQYPDPAGLMRGGPASPQTSAVCSSNGILFGGNFNAL